LRPDFASAQEALKQAQQMLQQQPPKKTF
jgi:hypothetical protein